MYELIKNQGIVSHVCTWQTQWKKFASQIDTLTVSFTCGLKYVVKTFAFLTYIRHCCLISNKHSWFPSNGVYLSSVWGGDGVQDEARGKWGEELGQNWSGSKNGKGGIVGGGGGK